MDEATRVVLRELARQAEWGTEREGGEARAQRLRETGRVLAARVEQQDRGGETWGHRAALELARHCQAAASNWSAEDVAELARLRETALTALAPEPGRTDLTPDRAGGPGRPKAGGLALPGVLASLRGRRAVVVGLAVVVVGAVLVAGLVLSRPGKAAGGAPQASSTTMAATSSPTTAASTSTSTTTSSQPSTGGTGTATGTASASATSTSSGTGAGSGSRVTAITMTASPADGYPEAQIYGTVTASGTGSVTYVVTVAGSSGQPQATTEDESGQTSYALSQTIYLQPWCGQKSVTITVSSGGVSTSSTVPISGC